MIKIILIAIVLVMVVSVPVMAFDEWTSDQKNMQIGLTILAIMDYGTTNYALNHPEMGYIESEAAIYGQPTNEQMIEYGAKLYLGHLLISCVLPSDWRNYWLKFGLGCQLYSVGNNLYIGCKLEF